MRSWGILIANQYKITNDRIWVIDWVRCINDILVSIGRSDLLRANSVSNLKTVNVGISRILSDLYAPKWNARVNVSSKGKQYFIT